MIAAKDWPAILQFGTGDTITEAEVEKHYRKAAKKAHPDAGGSNEAMTQVNLAKELALAWVAREREKVAVKPQIIQKVQYSQQQYMNAMQQQYASMANSASNSIGGLGNHAAANSYASSRSGQSKAEWLREFFRR